MVYRSKRKPDFNNLLKVLRRERPTRPTLFEFFMNDSVYRELAGDDFTPQGDKEDNWRLSTLAFQNAGYDYANIISTDFSFPAAKRERHSTISLNAGFVITDWESYEKYIWPEPENFDDSRIDKLTPILPEGMQWIVWGPGGVLENVITLVGYDNLCIMTFEEPELVQRIFDDVGRRLLKYYKIALEHAGVGAIISNDDWGFNTQTMLSTEDMRKYVFPWHKKIVAAAHEKNRPVILHSCGNLARVIDDIACDMKYDGKHSYEDNILPVEQAYEAYHDKFAVMGGLDMDFVCRKTPAEIKDRARRMLERTDLRGGYALGTGNSVPEYVPHENYYALISAAEE
ncbi:MAG: hypothetical protein LBU58_10970 [Clostridiales bacterium]|jgi:uroporphyrinogen decarboxylase|nr:hypothetical protein [Clostridiales bacterium]